MKNEKSAVEKIDFKKRDKDLYLPKGKPSFIDVPTMTFIMADGTGDPNTEPLFGEVTQLLYSFSYTLKMGLKFGKIKNDGRYPDWAVPPLEGLWWVPDMKNFDVRRKNDWLWTLMIRQPDFLDTALFAAAREAVLAKEPKSRVELVRLEQFTEGKCAQLMHTGPYSTEGKNIELLHSYIKENGAELFGKHHEIYLSDPRKADPSKLKTVIRQPARTVQAARRS